VKTHSAPVVILSAAFLGSLPSAFALEGRVVLKDGGTAVADAEVSVLGRPGSVRTGPDGRFVLSPDPKPPFELLVVLPGGRYLPPRRVDSLPAGPLSVDVAWTLEESVTVTAGSTPGTEGAPANGLTLLSARDLVGRAPANLAQAVENVAGASTVSEGQAAVPALRGFGRGRTLILIDGARVTAERRVGPSATYLDPIVIEAVEVSRGPGSVAYGSDAFGGVLHVRTRRAEPGQPLGGRFEGSLGAGAPQQRAALELSRGFERGGVLVQGHYRNFEDWTSPEGEVFNSGAEDRGFRVRVDHLLGGGLFSAAWQSDFGREIERPRNNSRTVRFFYPTEDSHRLTLAWERGPGETLSRLGFNAFLGRYSQVTDQDRFASAPRTVERADISSDDFHIRGFAGKPLGRARVEAGLDVNGRVGLEALDIGLTYDAAGALARTTTSVSIEDARRTDMGVYATADVPVGDTLLLAGGLRGDRVASRNRGGFFGDRSVTRTAGSGFASATVGPFSGFSVAAQVARGFRDPVLSDRYFRGPTGRGFMTGNPNLESETSLQLDLGLRYSRGGWRAAVYAFQYRIDDLSERFQTETDFFFFRNRGRARMRGLEAEVQATLPARFTVEVTGHAIRGVALDDDEAALDDVPPRTVTLRVRRDFDRGSAWVRVAAYGRLDHPGPNEQARPGLGLLDAGATVRLASAVDVSLLGRNLLDKAYLVSPDARAVLAAGRQGLASLTVRF
jgi:outer membrane receptor protein involved in Fe transport